MKHAGSCHCGRIVFEVEAALPAEVMACNCSMCVRKGALMWFVPRQALTLITPPEAMSTYTFNKHAIAHRFCPTCGVHPFGEATSPKGEHMAAINVRCIEGVDLAALTVQPYNGRDL